MARVSLSIGLLVCGVVALALSGVVGPEVPICESAG